MPRVLRRLFFPQNHFAKDRFEHEHPVSPITSEQPPGLLGHSIKPFHPNFLHPHRCAGHTTSNKIKTGPQAARRPGHSVVRNAWRSNVRLSAGPVRRTGCRPWNPGCSGSGRFLLLPKVAGMVVRRHRQLAIRDNVLGVCPLPFVQCPARRQGKRCDGHAWQPTWSGHRSTSEPATRSGNGRPENLDHQTIGIPSHTMKSAFSFTSSRSRLRSVSML